MRRELSTIEHLIDGNITYVVGLEGPLTPERLRPALARVQRKHPALRMLTGETGRRRFYEMDAAPEIPLRVVDMDASKAGAHSAGGTAMDELRRREIQAEVTTPFADDQPQLRVAWLRPADGAGATESELLVTAQHRICDGMSLLTIVRELLQALHSDAELVPYAPITTRDIIGELDAGGRRGNGLWKRRLAAGAVNALLALVPPSGRPLEHHEIHLEWSASQMLSSALRQRCRIESVSVHAALLLVLRETLQSVLGRDGPDWIECPVDARRGRLSVLRSDMLFFGGGSFRVDARQPPATDFWAQAREMSREIRQKVDQDVAGIPARYQFCEMLTPPSAGRIRSIVRLGDALSRNANWDRFSFSNLGNIVLDDVVPEDGGPDGIVPDDTSAGTRPRIRVTRFGLHVHSFATRILGLIAFSLHGQLHFIYTGDEKCLDRRRAEALGHAFMTLLERHVGQGMATFQEESVRDRIGTGSGPGGVEAG
ncbi:condensation domain-containing protein [Marilutibacter chinensis]|uniref:Condensation domain-containing protein n=1 Tax=Marilutibacter chinensis TaxID=2912247 RepID=A0ABS9HSG8_9GAMM|nr:condensation domain-containing protein [Lysobacter chinensis]MCF7221623.1 condensation domain-containing protein [Lysobacter chinensis]